MARASLSDVRTNILADVAAKHGSGTNIKDQTIATLTALAALPPIREVSEFGPVDVSSVQSALAGVDANQPNAIGAVSQYVWIAVRSSIAYAGEPGVLGVYNFYWT